MVEQYLIENLYKEMLLMGLILHLIMFHNTLVLCKRKWNDQISIMLMVTILMSGFELFWAQFDGMPELYVLTYIGAIGYAVAFLAFGASFSHFFLQQYGLSIKNVKLRWAIYTVPIAVFFLFCITTPWTGLVYWIDENGFTQEGILFQTYFYILLLINILSAIVPSFYYASSKKYADQTIGKIAKDLVFFSIIAPVVYVIQMVFLGVDSEYLALSLACTIALVYLCNNVNTRLLLESQAKMDAVQNDLRVAAKIQADALPPVAPEFARAKYRAQSSPCSI